MINATTLTDEHIDRLLRGVRDRMRLGQAEVGDSDIERAAFIARDARYRERRRLEAREDLAAAWNERHGGDNG